MLMSVPGDLRGGGREGRLARLLTWALVSANRSRQHMGGGADARGSGEQMPGDL